MNIPDLHKIHIFWMVARLGSFTQAAEALHMTQPTVSQQVAMLEQMLGTSLIERSTRSLRLTQAGQVLFDYADKLLPLAKEAVAAVHVAAGLAAQTLSLGVGHTLATYLLPSVLSQYRTQHPNYHVRLTVGNTAALLEKLASADFDLALVGSPADHHEVMTEPFMRDRLVAIVSAQDVWADRDFVTPDDLRERVFLTREPGSALYKSVLRVLGAEMLSSESETVILLGETEAIKRSVELGLGVALIQRIAITREIAAGTLKSIPLQGADDSRTYLLAWRKRHSFSAAERQFMDLLKQMPAPI